MAQTINYETFLKLETGSHSSNIRQVLVTPDSKTLITSGIDKTIRLWNIESKKQVGMLLGQIGAGSDGSIQSIALSPDGRYVIMLAWLDPYKTHSDRDRETDLRVYEFATGNLQAGFRFPGELQDLDFSPDGRYLAMIGNPKDTIRRDYVLVYETKTILKGFGKEPSPVASSALYDDDAVIPAYVRFVPDNQKKSTPYRIVVATWYPPEFTGGLLWYSFTPKGRLKNTTTCDLQVRPQSLAVSREFAVVSGGSRISDDEKKIYCYDHNGKFVSSVLSESRPAKPKFSQNGNQLIVGQSDDSSLVQVKVYDTALGQFHLKSTYYGHDAEVHAVALLQDGTAVSAGGDQNAIHFWSTSHMEGKQIGEINGVGRVVHAVGINSAEQIGIGNHDDLRHEDGSIVLQRLFDLRSMTLRLSSIDDATTYRRAITHIEEQQLKWDEDAQNPNLWLLSPGQYDMPLTGTPDPNKPGAYIWYKATTFGFTENLTIVTGDSAGKVRVAPRSADGTYKTLPWRNLIGHAARVLDHAACGRWLVTAGADQIIRLWYLPDVEQDVMTDLEPALNLFVGSDDEWVIWSKSGYYNASQRGDRRFGYHVNRGPDMEALYFPSDRFIKSFFRPEIIQLVLEHGSEERALAKLNEQNHPAAVDVSKILPPIVELSRNGITKTGEKVTFDFTVESLNPDRPLARIWIVQNDRFVWESQELKTKYKVTLSLMPGSNRFKILAENESAKSTPLILLFDGPEQKVGRKGKNKKNSSPMTLERGTARGGGADSVHSQADVILANQENGILYLLAVGVSDFEDKTSDFRPLKFPDADAIAVYNAFARTKISDKFDKKAKLQNKAFKAVEATILRNKEATKEAVLSHVKQISAKIKKRSEQKLPQRDVLFVFLSGHGVRQQGVPELYFWNYDLKTTKLESTGLSLLELGEIITSVPADVILAIDACHSGMAGSGVVKGLDPNELAKRIYAINERGMYILNAARSEEEAEENKAISHGVFTRSILDTLASYADAEDISVSVMDIIASVQILVQQYTDRRQTPTCRTYGDLLPLIIYQK